MSKMKIVTGEGFPVGGEASLRNRLVALGHVAPNNISSNAIHDAYLDLARDFELSYVSTNVGRGSPRGGVFLAPSTVAIFKVHYGIYRRSSEDVVMWGKERESLKRLALLLELPASFEKYDVVSYV